VKYMSFWGPLRISRIDVDVISSINIPPGDPKSDPDARLGRLGIQAIFLVSAHLPSFAISRLFLSSGEENVGMSHHPTLRIIYNHQKGVSIRQLLVRHNTTIRQNGTLSPPDPVAMVVCHKDCGKISSVAKIKVLSAGPSNGYDEHPSSWKICESLSGIK
jgi:hypothetical protein